MYHAIDLNGDNVRTTSDITIDATPINRQGATANIHQTSFRTARQPDVEYVAKLYKPEHPYYTNNYAAITEKLHFMVRNKHTYRKPNYAWPEFLIYQHTTAAHALDKGTLVGFLMRYIPNGHTVQHYIDNRTYNPHIRMRLAYSIAQSIPNLHHGDLYVGDLHPGNLLCVRNQDNLFDLHFIDCDSYAIRHANRTIHPPVLQPSGCYMLHKNPTTPEHIVDNERHATAYILFELLIGTSPYLARSPHFPAVNQLQNRVFPCQHDGLQGAHTSTKARFQQLPLSIQELFCQAFSTCDIPVIENFRREIYKIMTQQ